MWLQWLHQPREQRPKRPAYDNLPDPDKLSLRILRQDKRYFIGFELKDKPDTHATLPLSLVEVRLEAQEGADTLEAPGVQLSSVMISEGPEASAEPAVFLEVPSPEWNYIKANVSTPVD